MEVLRYKCDFLIAGGGIAGLMAAISAGRAGLDVIVAEKADTRRSGCGANGNDHFHCYIPQCHGNDIKRVRREIGGSFDAGPWVDQSMTNIWIDRSFSIIRMWEEMGINMRPTGEYRFEGHGVPGQQLYNLKFDGKKQKSALTNEAQANGARILNRVVANELLVNKNRRAVGAICVDINDEEPKLVVIQAKAVLLAMGMASRMYPSITPAYMFNTPCCPSVTGCAQAMAYRAGAKLVNMDMLNGHAGPKYFARGGKGTWIGISTDINGNTFTPYGTKPSRETGDVTADVWPTCYHDRMKDGKGPTYMDCRPTSPEDLDYMLHTAMVSEGIDSITDYLEQHNIDLSQEMIEFGTYPIMMGQRGVQVDEHSRTSVPGLYAAGDCTGNVNGSVSGAAAFGMIAGEDAAEYVKTVQEEDVSEYPQIAEKIKLFETLMNRKDGAHWKEALSALQDIMSEYAGVDQQNEDMLRAGYTYTLQLKENCLNELSCSNSHELMRTLEVLDMIDIAEPIFFCCENRKETRGPHVRSDYRYTNILLNNKFQTIEKNENGEIFMDFRMKH